MEEYNKIEHSIVNFGALRWNTIRKWRLILVSGLIIGALLGGSQFLSVIKGQTKEEVSTELSGLEEEFDTLTESLADLEAYSEDSLYMNLKYLKVVQTVLTVHIYPEEMIGDDSSPEENVISELVKAYTEQVVVEALYQSISEEVGYSTDYVNEIFTVTTDTSTGFIEFVIKSNDKSNNNMVANLIQAAFDACYEEISDTLYDHELSMRDPVSTTIVDETLNTYIEDKEEEISEIKASITLLIPAIAALEQDMLENGNVVIALKYGAIGGIVGGILGSIFMAMWLFFSALIRNRIQDGRYISEEHGLLIIGEKPVLLGTKNRIDRCINKWSNRGHLQTVEAFSEYITRVINYCIKGHKKIYITGTVSQEELEEVCDQIHSKIKGELVWGKNIGEDVNSLHKLLEADAVILIEKRFYTTDRELEAEIYKIRELQKEIMGVILL